MSEFEESGQNWTVDLAPCDPKVRLRFGSIEGELHYSNASHLAAALLLAINASEARWKNPDDEFPKIRREDIPRGVSEKPSKKPRCRLFHDWSKWGRPTAYKMVAIVHRTGVQSPYEEVRQRRECGRCGMIQERKLL